MFYYPKDDKYLLACSFGPDSMALFDMLIKEGYRLEVVHVNYHKRDVSDDEEHRLTEYCRDHGIKIHILDTHDMPCRGNFQAWARKVRYDFFKDVYQKTGANGLFVAHHLDDLLETYIWQKERCSIPNVFGLVEKVVNDEMIVLRPLLSFHKKELLKYCHDNEIPYSIDASNFSDAYRRNQIRHHTIEKMTDEDKRNLLVEIQEMNAKLLDERQNLDEMSTRLDIKTMQKDNASLILRTFLIRHFNGRTFSEKFIGECVKALTATKTFVAIKLDEHTSLIKDYDNIKISSFLSLDNYKYIMDHPKKLDTPYFLIDFSKSYEDRRIHIDDFPLTIRNIFPSDVVVIGGNSKKISRLFVEWKMPHELRKIWPIILNKTGKIIYVPRYKSDYKVHDDANFQIKELK